MENFTFECGTRIIFGRGAEEAVGLETKKYASKALLLYGQSSARKSGLLDKIKNSLKQNGVSFVELGGVVPNPRIELVREGIALLKKENIGFILAVGGGSVIDSAKAMAAGLYYDGDAWDLFTKNVSIERALPIGAVLTIPAAGSESSPNAVISSGTRKLPIGNNVLRPRFAIMDPELTLNLPLDHTAAGVSDMMAHIIERYFTNTKNVDLTDKLCEATMRSIIRNARLVMKEPKNYDHRAEIMWAGTVAHNGLLGTGREEDWASHRIEHELSAFYDITHGVGLAIIIPAWMRHVYKHDSKRFEQFAREVFGIIGENSALKGIEGLQAFFSEIGLPTSLKQIKIDGSRFHEMANQAVKNEYLGSFVKLTKDDVQKIYEKAL